MKKVFFVTSGPVITTFASPLSNKIRVDPRKQEGINCTSHTVKTLNIGTPRPATVVVLNIKQFNFTTK